MEVLTISGYLATDCETRTDKRGNNYIRFAVTVDGLDFLGKPKVTTYRCFSYNQQFKDLKANDKVIVSGKFNAIINEDKVNFDIWCNVIEKNK